MILPGLLHSSLASNTHMGPNGGSVVFLWCFKQGGTGCDSSSLCAVIVHWCEKEEEEPLRVVISVAGGEARGNEIPRQNEVRG